MTILEKDELSRFLMDFAGTFLQDKPALAANYCVVPNIIIGEQNKRVLNSKKELENFFMGFSEVLAMQGITSFLPIINQILRLSDSLYFTNIRWRLMDCHNEVIITWAASYTLQKTEDGQLMIIVTVVDDDHQQLKTMLPTELRL
ncbi:hypothetical protein [Paraglaciecola sp. 25GB23A]|uniref:hypothetical protein n=1 Tax=Paraglaciecola sp. 25GB23A TaxID=3156068 RepID=UPI0032AEBB9F